MATLREKVTSDISKTAFASCLLFLVPVLSVLHNSFLPDATHCFPYLQEGEHYDFLTLNPEKHACRHLVWLISLSSDRVIALIYLFVVLVRPKLPTLIIYLYVTFELFRLSDLWLTYEQTPVREWFSYALIGVNIAYTTLFINKN